MLRRSRAVALGCAVAGVTALPAVASASTTTVFAGPAPNTGKVAGKLLPKGFSGKYDPNINDFFLHRVTIAQGDSVKFVIAGFHTVDLPGSTGKPLPLLLPGKTVTGINDAAGNPFWFDGKLPGIGFNPVLFAKSGPSTYTGTKRIDSGAPLAGPPKPLNVKFTKPGTYKLYCDVHPGMVGYVVVKPKGSPVPSAKQNAAALVRQVKRDILSAKKLATTKVPVDTVSIGESNAFGLEFYEMFPSTLTVSPGTTVTFAMSKHTREDHTATFGPAKYLSTLAKGFASPTLPANAVYPSDPTQPLTLNQTSHGNGFANTGVLDQVAATKTIPSSGKITFTQAGTYHYVCLIHPFMRGTIIVK